MLFVSSRFSDKIFKEIIISDNLVITFFYEKILEQLVNLNGLNSTSRIVSLRRRGTGMRNANRSSSQSGLP